MDKNNRIFLAAVEAFAVIELIISMCLAQYQRETFELASMRVIYPIAACIIFGLLLGALLIKLGGKLKFKTFVLSLVINIVISTALLCSIHQGYDYFLILAGISIGGIIKTR